MANIGLDNFLYGFLTEAADGTATYGAARKPGKAISVNVSISNNSATLYADNVLAESATSFQSGTATIGLDEDDITTQAELLGHTVSSGEIIRNANDVAPYVGFGRIITKMVNGALKYKVEFLKKVKFAEPSQENSTKGESVEFGTVELEGTVATLANGEWGVAKTFDSRSAAVTYLNSFFFLDEVTEFPTTTSNHNGVIYTYQSATGNYVISGTSTGASVHIFAQGAIPENLMPGDRLLVNYVTTNPVCRFRVTWYDSENTIIQNDIFTENGYCTVPTGAVTWNVVFSVLEEDYTFSPAAVVSKYNIYFAPETA